MKHLIFTILFITTATAIHAQSAQTRRKAQEITPEQRAEIKSKKLALHLDLTEEQMQKVALAEKHHLSQGEALKTELHQKYQDNRREEGAGEAPEGKPRKRRQLPPEYQIKILDLQLAHQKEMKKILNEKQFREWKEMQKHKKRATKNSHRDKHHGKGRN